MNSTDDRQTDEINVDTLKASYQSVSKEEPSEFTDALILKSANKAIEKEQVKKSKRWQLPVSIAAGVVFTFSIVMQLEPWKNVSSNGTFTVNPMETSIERSQSDNRSSDNSQSFFKSSALSDQDQYQQAQQVHTQKIQARERREGEAKERQKIQEEIQFQAESKMLSKQREPQSKRLVQKPQNIKSQNLIADSVPVQSANISQRQFKNKSTLKTPQAMLINEQLTVIEYYIEQNNLQSAEKNLLLLLKHIEFDSLTESQQQRIKEIQATINK